MPITRPLLTDQDLQEAMDTHKRIRVFQNDHLIGSGGNIIRFDDQTVIIQSGVSDLAYHTRRDCQFFEIRK
ncbi:hypothetical protein J2Z69_001617 [Paenibacillus shirakamiensis]|uniref:Uncharacterized protein n=1 Tax=Paenibacillus shirakamiensis TaxID=1265935 RepID=A0ABS4JFU4_9BACL|nr:hypothetical protein [Paenibacillus shirakamiensis]MBP2000586.1 hypothetical protein [Paenibacillus shirakamiensis]